MAASTKKPRAKSGTKGARAALGSASIGMARMANAPPQNDRCQHDTSDQLHQGRCIAYLPGHGKTSVYHLRDVMIGATDKDPDLSVIEADGLGANLRAK